MRNNVTLISLLIWGGVACSQQVGKSPSQVGATTEAIRLSAQEAYAKWKANPNQVVILDVRTPEEYRSGHVKGAQNLDFYADFEKAVQNLPKDKTYFLHCASGRRSGMATEIMRKHGFRAYNVGGFTEVVQAGFPKE